MLKLPVEETKMSISDKRPFGKEHRKSDRKYAMKSNWSSATKEQLGYHNGTKRTNWFKC